MIFLLYYLMENIIIIVFAYFFITLVLSLFIKKSVSMGDFSTAKKSLSVFSVSASLVITHFGAGFVLGGAELGYKYAWFGLVYGISAAVGLFLLGLILSSKINSECNNRNIRTIPSFLFFKFKDYKLSLLASILSIIALVGIASAQIFAITKVFLVLNIPLLFGAILVTLVIISFSYKGIKSIAIFAKYNLLVVIVGAIIGLFFAVKIPNNGIVEFSNIGFEYFFILSIPTILYTIIGQDFHQKLYSLNDSKKIKNSCFLAGFILILLSFFPVFIGIMSKFMSIDATEVLPRFIIAFVPNLLNGFIIAAILVAVVGSAQSVINAASTQVSEDIFKDFFKFPETKLKKISIFFVFLFSLISLLLALYSSSIINNMISAYILYTSGMFIPILFAFFLKKTEKISKFMFFISLTGVILAAIFEFIIPLKMYSLLISVSSSLVLTIFLMKHS